MMPDDKKKSIHMFEIHDIKENKGRQKYSMLHDCEEWCYDT